MYLEYFGMKRFPFSLTPDTETFCNLPQHAEVYNTLLFAVQNEEPFIKVVGEVGTGKTLLCRMLLNALNEKYYTAYIPNPDLTPDGLRKALAMELNISFDQAADQHTLQTLLNNRLLFCSFVKILSACKGCFFNVLKMALRFISGVLIHFDGMGCFFL